MESILATKIKEYALEALLWGNRLVTEIDLKYIVLALASLVLITSFFIIRQAKKIYILKMKADIIDKVLSNYQPGKGLEKNLLDFLGLAIPLVEAPGYYFYLLDRKKDSYILKAVRNMDTEGGDLAPSYSGLVPYAKENYNPPMGIPAGKLPEKPVVIKAGEVPILILPIKGGAGQIRIGPVKDIPKKNMAVMKYLCEKLQPAVKILIEVDDIKSQIDSVSASSQAIKSLTRSANDMDGSLSTVLGLCVKMVESAGGCFIYTSGGRPELALAMGLDQETENIFRTDREAMRRLAVQVENESFVTLTPGSKGYHNIPSYFAAMGMEMLLLCRVVGRGAQGVAAIWFLKQPVIEQHRMAALQMLLKRLGDVLDRQLMIREMSKSYIDMFKMLVSAVDNLDVYTVGHSELVSRYSGIIAREMKLGNNQVRDIMTAGYLHDVGMLGLSGDILFKDGKYTDVEFEAMKLHAEVGASIVETTISNSEIASYIRHHHERFDGYGYPTGLKGEEIPLGARILSVADMFNAKLTGRRYREPASFERAVRDIRAAAGTQLDPDMVELLIGWFRKKRSDMSRRGRSLGPCWEMRCCPKNISSLCPAYKRFDVNCWEIDGVKCANHGNNCASCVVYTEYLYSEGAARRQGA